MAKIILASEQRSTRNVILLNNLNADSRASVILGNITLIYKLSNQLRPLFIMQQRKGGDNMKNQSGLVFEQNHQSLYEKTE